eukprot:scaffold132943_cov69-Phaeocystis_antarctica.AAC.3
MDARCGGTSKSRAGGVTTSRGRSSSAWTIIVKYRSHTCGAWQRRGTRMGGGERPGRLIASCWAAFSQHSSAKWRGAAAAFTKSLTRLIWPTDS